VNDHGFSETLDLQPGVSVRLHQWAFVVHVVPLVLLPFAMQPGWIMAVIAMAIGLSWISTRRHPVFGFGPRALVRMVWHADGAWSVHDAGGCRHDARLLASSVVSGPVLVLRFRVGQRTLTRALFGDEFPDDVMRRLRARLSVASRGR
jgi:toxin CptA